MADVPYKGEFNDAVGHILRIHICFVKINAAQEALDGHSWYHALNTLFSELSTYMNEKTRLELRNEVRRIGELLTSWEESEDRDMPQNLYLELFDYELALRLVYRDSGLQNKERDDATKGLR